VLKTHGAMGRGQVAAIQHLVAAAVAGLVPARVAIVDDKGELLAGGDDKTGPDATAQDQEDQTTGYEDRLRQRIESIVASVVGAGHVRVQVAADMNYNHESTTSETFDPDSKVVRSTQTVEQTANNTTGSSNNGVSVANALPTQPAATGSGSDKSDNSNRTEETTNYEISKTTKTSMVDGGTLKRVSVAVVVDGTSVADAAGKVSYTPRSAKDMAQIESLVKSAIGFDKTRGDQLQVSNMQFASIDTGPIAPTAAPLFGLDSGEWFKIIEVGILSLTALLIGFFVGRPMINRMFAPMALSPAAQQVFVTAQPVAGQIAAPVAAAAGASPAAIASAPAQSGGALPARENMIDISRIEGQVRESSIRKVGEVVQAHPEEALAILRTWLHQPV
jgi:flagellar M-ring protein FliF